MPPKKQQAKQNNLKKGNESPAPAAASSVLPNPGQSDYRTQQLEELETLRAIYAEDFEQVQGKTAAWSVRSLDPTFIPQADLLEICRSCI
jgi:hypothetical protein